MPLLQVEKLTKRFGGLVAVDQVDLELQPGEIRGLIGPNGSGKTTTFNLLTGIYRPDAGTVIFQGRDLTRLPAHQIAQAGVARTFQEIELFYDMTVLENAMVGAHRLTKADVLAAILRPSWVTAEERFAREKARAALAFVGLDRSESELARNLPYGHQRLLEIARALAGDPILLLLDEPAAGMNLREADELMDLIRRINERGTTVLLVEHNMRLVMRICQRVTVLNYGRKIAEGTPTEVQQNADVIEAYLGKRRAHA